MKGCLQAYKKFVYCTNIDFRDCGISQKKLSIVAVHILFIHKVGSAVAQWWSA